MTTRDASQWAARELGENSVLVLGWRKGKRLQAGRLILDKSMDTDLRSRADVTLGVIGTRSVRGYEPTAQLEGDEVFLLQVDDLPSRPVAETKGSAKDAESSDLVEDQQAEASALITLLGEPGELDPLDADDARDRPFLFYAAVFTDEGGGEPIAFIKRYNSASVLKTGLLLGQWGQTITKVERPVLVFAADFDLVVDGEEIAALTPDAILRTFADVEIAAAAVPALVKELASTQLGLDRKASDAITRACSGRRLLARRLQVLLSQTHLADLAPDDVLRYLERTGQDPTRFVHDEQIRVAEEDVADLIDVLGQAHYRGGYDELLRRADRSSLVKGKK